MTQLKRDPPGRWPQKRHEDDETDPWLHSDFAAVAYYYTHRVFEQWVTQGALDDE